MNLKRLALEMNDLGKTGSWSQLTSGFWRLPLPMNPPTAPPPAGNRILIIDDNPSIHDDLRKILAAPKRRLDDLDAAEAEIFGVPTALKPSTAFEMDSAYQGMEGRDCVEAALREG